MTKKSLILIGGGGHCKSCIDIVENTGEWNIKGILDTKLSIGEFVLDYPVIGNDDDLLKLINDDNYFLITVGQIKSAGIRKRLYIDLKKKLAKIATVISPFATVSKHAIIGEGTVVHHHSIINANATIGDNSIINTAANVEHDTRIGNNTHISTGCIINGSVIIGNECFIGSGCIIANNVKITDKVIIGAGSLVIRNISAHGTYVGSPIKRI
jgi:sugar O-acyltransferase (sialic acid O-acetyltransferase NeuD family)